jgi:hypothetical protein
MRMRALVVTSTLVLLTSACSAGGESQLGAAHSACSDAEAVTADYDAAKSSVLPDYSQSLNEDLAHERGLSLVEYHAALIEELAIYDEEEDSLVLTGAFEQYEDAVTSVGLLGSIIQTCVLDEMEVPERVRSHLGSTRALDGTQEDAWDDYEARWTYHPDSGTNLTIWRATES